MEDVPGRRPDKDDDDRDNEGPCGAENLGGVPREDAEDITDAAEKIAVFFGASFVGFRGDNACESVFSQRVRL